jgi:hypothetical protein
VVKYINKKGESAMKFSNVELELIAEGLKLIKPGYESRNCENVVNRIDDLLDRLKKHGQG